MNDMIVTFRRPDVGADWTSDRDANACAVGVREYLEIPDSVMKFDAIFTEDEPADDFGAFHLDGDDNLDTEEEIEFYDGAKELLREASRAGYEYLYVQYEQPHPE